MKYNILSILLLFASCKTVQPLQANYDTKPYRITTTSNFETIWNNIIDIYSQNGKSFRIISKPDGLIVVQEKVSPVTYEEKGQMVNATAWAIAEKVYEPGNERYFLPTQGIIEWNIHIKHNNDNSTTIDINIVSPMTVTKAFLAAFGENKRVYKAKAFSTGVYEKQLEMQLKQ
jgi:hypothetical protein